MSNALGRSANVLGALALTVADQMSAAVAAAAGQSLSGAAALTALDEFLGEPTIDRLAQTLGLTHSGAVRLVDRMSEAGLVARGAAGDKRSRSIRLTERGRAAAATVAEARAAVLAAGLAELDDVEREALGTLLDKVMAGVVNAKDGGAWICRMCDFEACERGSGHCPAMNAALARRDRTDAADAGDTP